MVGREELIKEGKALEIKEGFLLFGTIDAKRQENETFEEYKFRQRIIRQAGKKFKKG